MNFVGRCAICMYSTGGCTGACRPGSGPQLPAQPTFYPNPKGCICPPTAEETCKRSDCGRRDMTVTYGVTHVQSAKPDGGAA